MLAAASGAADAMDGEKKQDATSGIDLSILDGNNEAAGAAAAAEEEDLYS